MPRPPKKIKRQSCRPQIPLDWSVIDKYLEAGCTGVEIASAVGCHSKTLYDRCEQEKGVSFTTYAAEKKACGDALIRAKQLAFAMTGKNGNLGMLIWLGKNRLGQRDEPRTEEAFNGKLAQVLDLMKEVKKESDFILKKDQPEETQ